MTNEELKKKLNDIVKKVAKEINDAIENEWWSDVPELRGKLNAYLQVISFMKTPEEEPVNEGFKESEDERIKEAISYAIANSTHEDGILINGVTESEAITWLKKAIIPNYNDIDSSFIEDIKEVILDAPFLMQSDKEKMIAWLEKQGDIDRRIQEEIEKQTKQQWKTEKQGEQKSAENSSKVSESSTEEKDMGEYKKGFECGKQRVLKYPEDFGLCKKPTWSEEDEEMFKRALKYLQQSYYSEESVVSWLKSLKERVQPKQELRKEKKEWIEKAFEFFNKKLYLYKEYEEDLDGVGRTFEFLTCDYDTTDEFNEAFKKHMEQ